MGTVALMIVALLAGVLAGRATVGNGASGGSSSGGPPVEVKSGVPTGYSHNERGAASAAANLSAALAYSIAEGPGRVQEAARVAGTDRYAARVSGAYDGRQVLDPSATVLFRAVPITYRMLAYSPDEALVRVWSASILAGNDSDPGVATFKTATIVVRWEDGDWKVDDVRDPTQGPTPVTREPSPGTDFVSGLDEMEAFLVQP